MKMYWEKDGENIDWFLTDAVQGLEGCRKWLLEVIPDNESILDIGCGPGHVYEIFKKANRSNDYLGIDIDPNYLKLAQTFFPGIQTRQTDTFFLPWRSEGFDNSIFFSVLEMLPDYRKPIDEAIRVTKKQVIITTYIPLIDGHDENALAVNYPQGYIVRFNKDNFLKYLNSFGYPIVSGELVYQNQTKYWYWIIQKNG